MNVYTNITFAGHYPVGSAAVVVATSRITAAKALSVALSQQGLAQEIKPEDMHIIDPGHQHVRILNDGNY